MLDSSVLVNNAWQVIYHIEVMIDYEKLLIEVMIDYEKLL